LPSGRSLTLLESCEFGTNHPPPGGWDGNAPQGSIIPPDFSAQGYINPPEDCSTHPKVRFAVMNEIGCAIEMIELQQSQADLCRVSVVYYVSLFIVLYYFS